MYFLWRSGIALLAITKIQRIDLYGNAWGDQAPWENTISFNLRFAGQYYDAETKLHYNWHRDYNPQTGRYMQSDPIGLNGGWNVYNYVNGMPTMGVDKRGLDTYVILGGVKSNSYNIFGHIAIGTDFGGIYSFGNTTTFGTSIYHYVASQSSGISYPEMGIKNDNGNGPGRDQMIIRLPSTPFQELLMDVKARELDRQGAVDKYADNCASRTKKILLAGSFKVSWQYFNFPMHIYRAAKNNYGAQEFLLNENSEPFIFLPKLKTNYFMQYSLSNLY